MASVWKITSGFFSLTAAEIAAISCTAPTSLFTYITETSTVSGRIRESNSERSTCPSLSTGAKLNENPISSRNLSGAFTEACSNFVAIICFPTRLFASAVPINAILFASVPPEVKTISFGCALSVFAIIACADFTYFSASIPFLCREEGFPKSSPITRFITSRTESATLVVAALSK